MSQFVSQLEPDGHGISSTTGRPVVALPSQRDGLPNDDQGVGVVGDCVANPAWGTLNPAFAVQVASLVNAHRTGMGLNTLGVSATLTRIAQYKSLNMSGFMYLAHDDPAPVARTVSDRFRACGYSAYLAWGENIAYGLQTPQDVIDAWLSDVPHRQNIENSSWTTIGVGVVLATNGLLFWTQDFGTDTPAPPPPVTPLAKWQANALPHLERMTGTWTTWSRLWPAEHDGVTAFLAGQGPLPAVKSQYGQFVVQTLKILSD